MKHIDFEFNGKFLLTPLCEGRLPNSGHTQKLHSISTHAPLRGATQLFPARFVGEEFLLTPLCEGRPTMPAGLICPE